MAYIVIGGAGFVGSNLVSALKASGRRPVVLDLEWALRAVERPSRLSDQFRGELLSGIETHTADVRDREALENLFGRIGAEVIYYLAALPIVSAAETSYVAASDSMVRGLANALEAARVTPGIRRFVYVSSSMVYGNFDSYPVTEKAATVPLNLYGGLKLAGEHLVRAYLNTSDIEPVIVRPSGVYGPGDPHGRVVQKFCESALVGAPVQAINPTDTLVDFTWVGDVADGLILAGHAPAAAGRTYNLTRSSGRSLEELIAIVQAHEPGLKIERRIVETPLRPKRGSHDITAARRDLGFEPKVGLEAGVAAYLAHLRGDQCAGAEQAALLA